MEDGVTLDVPSFSSLYFFPCLDLGPVKMAMASVVTTSGDKSSGGEDFPCAGSAEWLPYSTDRVWDLRVHTFAYVERLFDCFLSYSCTGLYSPGGLPQRRGIM